MSDNPLRVLVVDDTVIYRKIVSDILKELPEVEVVGVAHNGKAALSKIDTLKPDVLTLDIEMPEMNGIEVLSALKAHSSHVGAIMLSTLTQKGSDMTVKALELGAFDFIPKPETSSMAESKAAVKNALASMLKAFARRKDLQTILYGKGAGPVHAKCRREKAVEAVQHRGATSVAQRSKSEIVGIGISTGGPNALAQMLPKLPGDLNVPVLIVQHMPPIFTQSLAKSLSSKCALEVKEAGDGEPLKPNVVYIAPGGKQMKVTAGSDGKTRIIRVTDDPPENSCKPSVDYLFRSVADHYVGRATGVIMTGMGADGTEGLKQVKKNGATVIAQSEETCVVYGMPKEAIESNIVDVIAPLDHIAKEIVRTVRSASQER
jgi:two-component system chemotaxis response regulator CheB